MIDGTTKDWIIKSIRISGILLIFLGIALNPIVIEKLFVADKNIESAHNIVMIIIFELFLILLGLPLYLKPIFVIDKRKEIALLFVSLMVCFLFLEIISRIYLCYFMSPEKQIRYLLYGQCDIPSPYSPHQYLAYYGTPNYNSSDGLNIHNSYGYRGPEIEIPKPEGIYRIVILGGSTTYTLEAKDWRMDFPRQLQKELQNKYNNSGIEVVNAGLSGWTSWEDLINLEFRVLDLEPDLIIVYQNINDVSMRLVNPTSYKGDNSGGRKVWGIELFPLFHSTLIRLITGINPTRYGDYVIAPTSAAFTKETGFIQKLNGTALETLQKNKPIYFERNLKNMIAIAKENNITILLATWAYSKQFDSYATTPHYMFGISEQNEIIKNVGKDHNVLVYDFASEMPEEKDYWVEGIHLNEQGLELQGELFADYISNTTVGDTIITLKS